MKNKKNKLIPPTNEESMPRCRHRGKYSSPLCLRKGILSGDCISEEICPHYKPQKTPT